MIRLTRGRSMSGDMYSQQQRLENKLSKSTPRTQSQITPLYHEIIENS